MISLVKESHSDLLSFLEELSPAALLKDQGVRRGRYKVIISRLIEVEIKDERTHLEQIRQFLV